MSQDLTRRLQEGDRNALREIYHAHSSLVYTTALSFVQDEMLAEEVTQDVFLEAYRSANSFKGNSKLSTWLYRICTNKSLDQIRKKKAQKRSGDTYSINDDEIGLSIPDFKHPGTELENQELSQFLFAAIDQLNENQKAAFIFSQIDGLPQKEISKILEVSIKSVESLIQRAKVNLRKILRVYYEKYKE